MDYNRKTVEKAILYTLIGGAIIISPFGGKVVVGLASYYLKKWWDEGGPYIPMERDPDKVRESLYRLNRSKYVVWKYDKKKNIVKLELTSRGKKFFAKANFDDIKIPVQPKWDRKWRFFIFDIPEKSKRFRNILRSKLKGIGFFQFQKSVWVYPFECEKEMQYICEYIGISGFAMTFTAEVHNDKILRKYFYDKGVLDRKYLTIRDRYLRT